MPTRPQAPKVLAGEFRGRKLRVPKGRVTRPARALVRRSMFDKNQGRIAACSWLDLFAGSGSIGIEALSRGARRATFVESGPRGFEALRENLTDLGLKPPRAVILRRSLPQFLFGMPPEHAPFDFVSMDPPFAVSHNSRQLSDLIAGLTHARSRRWFAAEARLIWEEPADSPAPLIPGFKEIERSDFGISRIRYFAVA